MRKPQSRRAFLTRSAALAIASFAPRISLADTIAATAISPGLIAAAQKEGKVVWYTSVDLPVAEKIARGFEAKHPGVPVRVERNGSERLFQRIEQELTSGIHAGDVEHVGWRPFRDLEARRSSAALSAERSGGISAQGANRS